MDLSRAVASGPRQSEQVRVLSLPTHRPARQPLSGVRQHPNTADAQRLTPDANNPHVPAPTATPLRLLIVLPSWLGDVVMATPALRLLRRSLPGIFIGALARPGLDELLAGTTF